ncbi:flavin reductase family protein [Micromonospora sp. NBC_01796]|uniref:flavin reductase family protein n=1 Tax=Micromonospora sp. NBC_01796 TaxID=2975987 RepID=UPI002DD95EBB|nr:flavin reductase family protein [Micromonospora sp. NBC_01796]WSA87444.1 flavin reductase family protein [Micromonospora sp. NBC_01796]
MDVQAKPSSTAEIQLLRRSFSAYATGVTVVTVGGDAPHGMTANSFTTVSLDPPLVLVCVGRQAIMHGLLAETGTFGVSVLSAHQEAVARYFADKRRPLGAEQFEAVDCVPGQITGAPLVRGALAHFECKLRAAYDGGDHTIFVGELLSLDRHLDDKALLFYLGRFAQFDFE